MRPVSVEVISDNVCPWCWVGKRRLEKAIKSVEASGNGAPVSVSFRAFQLRPDAPKAGVDKVEMYQQKFGPGWMSIVGRVQKAFEAEGLELNMGGLTGNTVDSHRALCWAQSTGGPAAQQALAEEIFAAYFTRNEHIGDAGVLADAARRAGLNAEELQAVLASDEYAEEVDADMQYARSLGVSGVPYFVIDGKVGLSGAQPAEELASAILQASGRGAA
ncbi:unnamed protein product [Pedinophyceae sp. YPF-701]|nr:unnamed protein product [Pedinophyceae sp. YPF-701]